MSRSTWLGALGLGVSVLLISSPLFSGDDPNGAIDKGIFDQVAIVKSDDNVVQEGVQPLAKGVIHEAFASPSVSVAQAGPIIPNAPPQAIEEMPPEQKPDGDNVQWINGYFGHDDEKKDFYWVSGIWRDVPPNMEWVPGNWSQVTGGYQYFSGFWKQAGEGQLAVVPMPPEPLTTVDPPAPSADSTYVPGTWVYRETRYVWRPACWVPYRQGWVWCPARYVWTRCGWVFLEGHWDYTLAERGLLFCPVYVSANYYQRPGWIYRPQYVVHDQCLLSCLFVNRRLGCYHFGNYYGNNYANSGYVAWSSYRHNNQPEPLFSHYRHIHRNNPTWERNLVSLHVARYKGDAPRPPENLFAQSKLLRGNNVTGVNNLVLLAPLNRVNNKVVPLKKLDAVQLQSHVQNVQKQKEASQLRARHEETVFKNFGTLKVGEQAKVLTLNLPKTTQTTVLTERVKTIPTNPQGGRSQLPTTTTGTKGPVVNKGNDDKKVIVITPPKDTKGTGGTTTNPPRDKVIITPPKDNKGTGGTTTNPPKDKVIITPPKDTKGTGGTTTNPPRDKVIITPPKDNKGTGGDTNPTPKIIPKGKISALTNNNAGTTSSTTIQRRDDGTVQRPRTADALGARASKK